MSSLFKGAATALITPLKDDKIDFEALKDFLTCSLTPA